jgi:Fe-S cluster assembly iron-binding protein IscA
VINVTQRAGKELMKILNSHVDNWYARLRLVSRGEGRIGLGIDIEMPGDEVVECEGTRVLVVARELAASLDGVTIDAEDDGDYPQFVLLEKSGL